MPKVLNPGSGQEFVHTLAGAVEAIFAAAAKPEQEDALVT
jgi:hypothetical protein